MEDISNDEMSMNDYDDDDDDEEEEELVLPVSASSLQRRFFTFSPDQHPPQGGTILHRAMAIGATQTAQTTSRQTQKQKKNQKKTKNQKPTVDIKQERLDLAEMGIDFPSPPNMDTPLIGGTTPMNNESARLLPPPQDRQPQRQDYNSMNVSQSSHNNNISSPSDPEEIMMTTMIMEQGEEDNLTPLERRGRSLWAKLRHAVQNESFQIYSRLNEMEDEVEDDEDEENQSTRPLLFGSSKQQHASSASLQSRFSSGGNSASSSSSNSHHHRSSKAKKKKNRKAETFREVEESLPYDYSAWDCLVWFTCYLGIGVVAFSFVFEQWDIVDSLYFSVVTFTTIGYGDLVPMTTGGRLFLIVFALGGVAVLGIGLGVVGSQLVEAEVHALQHASHDATHHILQLFRSSKHPKKEASASASASTTPTSSVMFTAKSHSHSFGSDMGDSSSVVSSDYDDDEEDEEEPRLSYYQRMWSGWWATFCRVVGRYSPGFLPLIVASVFMKHHEGWALDEALYYMVVTTTTIGFGDFTPDRAWLKLCAVVFIPLGVGTMGHVLGEVANVIVQERRHAFQRRVWTHELKMEDLEEMSDRHDGVVTRLDYMEFMLVTMKKVDRDTLDILHSQFDELDLTHSGTLVKRDLELMARKRLRKVRKKLKLSAYKYKLTHPPTANKTTTKAPVK
eukprot:scaffold113525_cov46-Attheya_sp.AAC.1